MKIHNYKTIGKGNLKASFSLTLTSGLVIHDVALFEKNGSRWIGMPRQRFSDANGNTTFTLIVDFTSREVAERFRDEVVSALKAAGYIREKAA